MSGTNKTSSDSRFALFSAPATAAFSVASNHWRFRAEETRTVADQMTHEESRTIMRRIAMDYDRLAKLDEEQLADQEKGAIRPKT